MSVVTGPDNRKDQAFTELVQRHQTSLRRMCYAMIRDEELAKDAVQETFVKAYRALDTWRGDCSEKTWLMKISVNTCRDMLRGAWFRRIDSRVALENLPQPTVQLTEDHVELTLAIMKLPQKLREVTLLHYSQDMTMREIAQALGISPSTVSKRLDRAHAKLRTLLEGRELHG